jgi:hypothetical protein
VIGRAFRPIAFEPPYEANTLRFRDTGSGTAVEAVDGGIRCTAHPASDITCTTLGQEVNRAGIHVTVDRLAAARFDLTLIQPENIIAVDAVARADANRSEHWRWEVDPVVQQLGFSGAITLVPGYPAHRFMVLGNTTRAQDVRELQLWVEIKPGTHAGFELRHLEVADH